MVNTYMQKTKIITESLWERLTEKVRKTPSRIVFPDGEDSRVVRAAEILGSKGLAYPVLLGDSRKIKMCAQKEGVSLDKIEVISPSENPDREQFISLLLDIRKKKGLSRAKAEEMVDDILFHGCLMVRAAKVDGFVGGASRTTADTVRAGLTVLGVERTIKTLSGAFIMHVPGSPYGNNGWFVYADCAVVPHPTAEQRADIAYASAKTYRLFLEDEPRVAFLSFSTRGSAHDACLESIRTAIDILKKKAPDLKADGEFQVDAALDKKVASRKMKGYVSEVAGKANVLIFPDLNAGNIAYKLTQRLAHAQAIGPILQGLNGALNDLSRGCSVEDIIKSALITSVQAKDLV